MDSQHGLVPGRRSGRPQRARQVEDRLLIVLRAVSVDLGMTVSVFSAALTWGDLGISQDKKGMTDVMEI